MKKVITKEDIIYRSKNVIKLTKKYVEFKIL